MKKLKVGTVAAALFLAAGMTANAATVTYENADATPKMRLTIGDSVAGIFRFSLTTLVGTADYLGFGFNLAGTGNPLTAAMFTLISATNASDAESTAHVGLQLWGNDTGSQTKCGPGCTFNGAGSASKFDYILRIGDNGAGPNDYVKTAVFDLAYAGSLANNPFSQFAVRAQSTSNSTGSIKADLEPVAAVPLPAGGVLMMAALGGLAALRRKRKAA